MYEHHNSTTNTMSVRRFYGCNASYILIMHVLCRQHYNIESPNQAQKKMEYQMIEGRKE